MIHQLIRMLIVMLIGSKYEPVHSLHKRKEPVNLKGLNWTFIILTLAMVLFFVFILVFQIGNEYPNQLMENL